MFRQAAIGISFPSVTASDPSWSSVDCITIISWKRRSLSARRNSCGPHVMVTDILTRFVDPFIKARLHKDVGNTVKKAQELPNAWYVQPTFFELILHR